MSKPSSISSQKIRSGATVSCSIKQTCRARFAKLIKELKKAGFVNRGGKGSLRNFLHSTGAHFTISGSENDDAQHYQERAVKERIDKIKDAKE